MKSISPICRCFQTWINLNPFLFPSESSFFFFLCAVKLGSYLHAGLDKNTQTLMLISRTHTKNEDHEDA